MFNIFPLFLYSTS
jgi:hypothetical protein